MFCPNCGAQIPDGKAFCTQCGARLVRRDQTGTAATGAHAAQPGADDRKHEPKRAAVPVPMTNAAPDHADGAAQGSQAAQAQAGTRSAHAAHTAAAAAAPKKVPIPAVVGATVAVAAVVAGGAFAWWRLAGPGSQASQADQPAATQTTPADDSGSQDAPAKTDEQRMASAYLDVLNSLTQTYGQGYLAVDQLSDNYSVAYAKGVCYAQLVDFGDGVQRLVVAYNTIAGATSSDLLQATTDAPYRIAVYGYNSGTGAADQLAELPAQGSNGGYSYFEYVGPGSDGKTYLPSGMLEGNTEAVYGLGADGSFGSVKTFEPYLADTLEGVELLIDGQQVDSDTFQSEFASWNAGTSGWWFMSYGDNANTVTSTVDPGNRDASYQAHAPADTLETVTTLTKQLQDAANGSSGSGSDAQASSSSDDAAAQRKAQLYAATSSYSDDYVSFSYPKIWDGTLTIGSQGHVGGNFHTDVNTSDFSVFWRIDGMAGDQNYQILDLKGGDYARDVWLWGHGQTGTYSQDVASKLLACATAGVLTDDEVIALDSADAAEQAGAAASQDMLDTVIKPTIKVN